MAVSRALGRFRRRALGYVPELRSLQRRRRDLAVLLRDPRFELAPGWYWIERSGRCAWRIGTRRPKALRLVLSNRLRLQSWRERAWTRLTSFVWNALTLPQAIHRTTARSSRTSSTALFDSRRGRVLAFAPGSKKVTTHFTDAGGAEDSLASQRELADYLPVVPFEPGEDARAVVAPYINGVPMHRASTDAQFLAYRELLAGLCRLTQDRRHPPMSAAEAQEAVGIGLEFTTGPCNEFLGRHSEQLAAYLRGSPLVPSHGDMCGNNIIVAADGAKVVDLEQFGLMPFFFDALMIPLVNARDLGSSQLLLAVYAGDFDPLLDDLHRRAGMPDFGAVRMLSLLATFVLNLRMAPLRDTPPDVIASWSEPLNRLLARSR